ncbi:hypothetical protein [Streptomyces sp. S4.7]|uniref:hypothetical protein n=1 Tax=Streptomyces sp. S4.7 TaxID=2705439 RepID=UPI00193F2F71|nr:hypothetical protein [Streptomyces sp. S4.7]
MIWPPKVLLLPLGVAKPEMSEPVTFMLLVAVVDFWLCSSTPAAVVPPLTSFRLCNWKPLTLSAATAAE